MTTLTLTTSQTLQRKPLHQPQAQYSSAAAVVLVGNPRRTPSKPKINADEFFLAFLSEQQQILVLPAQPVSDLRSYYWPQPQ